MWYLMFKEFKAACVGKTRAPASDMSWLRAAASQKPTLHDQELSNSGRMTKRRRRLSV